jgi:hypothetical protein
MWDINKKFLEMQAVQGKSFEFAADPKADLPTSYTAREYDYLLNSGYKLINDGAVYRAVKK